jgi:ubiquinone/menaquinone biosynthesis C-methylase UbiE
MTAVKAYKGIGMNGVVAKWYATNASKRMDQFRLWAERAAQLASGNEILEIAPGPGYFSIELAKRGAYNITGLDISKTFVEIGRKNAAEANAVVDFQHGNSSQMPFPDKRFDFVFCSSAFKNFTEPVAALREMHRVLKPGGRALIFDLRKDASRQDIESAVESSGVNRLNKALTRVIFRTMLLKRAYTKNQIERFVSQTAFRSFNIEEQSIALEILLTN